MFLIKNWYVAAFSADIKQQPVGRMICGMPVVMYRTASGTCVALEDRCIHRGVPLSFGGECEGDMIRCPYHAFEFDPSGRCTKVPGEDRIPDDARIRSYKTVERDGLVWIWMGTKEEADEELLQSPAYHSDPEWTWTSIFLEINCDWQMLNDNLLDLTHLGTVHKKTIGGNPDQHSAARMKTTRQGERGVLVTRQLPMSDPPPHYLKVKEFKGKIDRWTDIEFVPGVIKIWSGGLDAGTGAYEGKRVGGVQFLGFHGVTPSAKRRCYYHFTQAYNFEAADKLREVLHNGALTTLLEDKAILEVQQQRLDETPDRPMVDRRADAAGIQARRIITRLHAAENEALGR